MPVITDDILNLHVKGSDVPSVFTKQEIHDKYGWVFVCGKKTVKITNAGDANGKYPVGKHIGKPGDKPVLAIHNVPFSRTSVARRVTILI